MTYYEYSELTELRALKATESRLSLRALSLELDCPIQTIRENQTQRTTCCFDISEDHLVSMGNDE